MTLTHDAAATETPLASAPAFIEVQLPVSKLSKESYKERKAVSGQTLTALGKWWGRKPLVLVRAAILGLLLPATDDPAEDRAVFMALMTMDDDGMLRRLKSLPGAAAIYRHATTSERRDHFAMQEGTGKQVGKSVPRWLPGVSQAGRRRLARLAFLRMGYDERLEHCLRPEEIDGPSPEAWARINRHLGTEAASLSELVQELGQRRFGHAPRVADAFCGGGSVPFEAARIGCEAFGSDLNPVAALLTWGALNIVGGGPAVVADVRAAQERVYEAARLQVEAWGIERNEDGWVADAYLYCNEVLDPATGWRVPLAPSWVIGQSIGVIARLIPDPVNRRFDIQILEGVSNEEVKQASLEGTWEFGGVRCPVTASGSPLPPQDRAVTRRALLRGRDGLRSWERDDLAPRPTDVFQERLYCIRWVDSAGQRHFRAPTAMDQDRELYVHQLLRQLMPMWLAEGHLPTARIEPGAKTSDPIGMRGWTYWHHLFNPRQLLLAGLFSSADTRPGTELAGEAGILLSQTRFVDWNSRLARWGPQQSAGAGGSHQTFYDQSLAPLVNYACRGLSGLRPILCMSLKTNALAGASAVQLMDARSVTAEADLWITDPGYADAVHYEEISEFFLAWLEKRLPKVFPDWYADSRRALAVRGTGQTFRQAMVECYTRFASLMPDNGFQIVMFTHTSAEVWADLALILWASGLRVSAAWTIGTETAAVGIREGRFVQGTVLLVLRKRQGAKRGDLADIYPDVQAEVQSQLEAMLQLDPKEDPNFSDADYQLAAYAAALRVLTAYERIDDIDVARELQRGSGKGERSRLTGLIERAVRIASDYLVPDGLDRTVWRRLSPEERLYCKGVEIEAHGEYREGVYQEFARGLGVTEYKHLLAGAVANQTRLKTPSEFGNRDLRPREEGFAGSLLRLALFAVATTATRQDPKPGRDYLRAEVADYWEQRVTLAALLRYLATRPALESGEMGRWKPDAEAASDLATVISNDRV